MTLGDKDPLCLGSVRSQWVTRSQEIPMGQKQLCVGQQIRAKMLSPLSPVKPLSLHQHPLELAERQVLILEGVSIEHPPKKTQSQCL